MIIQSYNVSASSQRTSLSVQAATVSAAKENHSAQFSGTNGQTQNTTASPNQNVNQKQNQNDQGQNQNNQGQNVNNHGQNNEDSFKNLLRRAKDERIEELIRGRKTSHASRLTQNNGRKMPTTPQELRASLSQIILQLLSGKNFKHKPPQIDNIDDWRGIDIHSFFGGFFGLTSAGQVQGAGTIQLEHLHYESETVTYKAQGVVLTADGKEINIDINMHMSREFVSYMNISTENTRLYDPLVINYGGTAASLTGEKFLFDLTMDGNLDSLAILGQGSGFLAIDWNGDGIINDGSELFGPSTGCGFSELRKYDTDGNGWIDANDEIFDKLVVWSRDKDGNDTVYTLKELGIGAIFLGDVSTEFSFKGDNNETLGIMRSTSFFLKQCGSAGTLSHIDLNL